jgi:hypothetical protein
VVFEVCAAWLASWFILYFAQTTQLKRKKEATNVSKWFNWIKLLMNVEFPAFL